MRRETKLLHYGRGQLPGPANPPVVRASTILHETLDSFDATKQKRDGDDHVLSYGRRGTTTAHALMYAINDLEGGDGCWLFPSGVAAIATTLQAFLHSGDHLLITEAAFHATHTICEQILRPNGVAIDIIPADAADVSAWSRPETKVVFAESPSSDSFAVMDLPALCASAHACNAIVIADNTYGSAWLYRPLELGCDVSIIAGTKYLSGHADVMMGAATARGAATKPLRQAVLATGQTLAPDEAYATLRGMRTLNLRLERHQENAIQVARWFENKDFVQQVLHPGLPQHPGNALWLRDATGTNGLLSVIFEPDFDQKTFLGSLRLFKFGSSWGGFESLVKLATLTDKRDAVRFHVGLEHADDVIEDLEYALEQAMPG